MKLSQKLKIKRACIVQKYLKLTRAEARDSSNLPPMIPSWYQTIQNMHRNMHAYLIPLHAHNGSNVFELEKLAFVTSE